MARIKAVAFDCDGVVLDSFKNVHLAYQAIARHFGIKCPEDINEFRKLYSKHPKWTELLAYLGVSGDNVRKADEIFKREYARTKPRPFEGIFETLENLSDVYPLFLVTTSHQNDVRNLFREYGLSDFFQEIRGGEKPGTYCGKTQTLIEIMGRRNWMPAEMIMVGDRDNDFFEAREAGIPAGNIVLVDYGWGYDKSKVEKAGYNLKTKVFETLDIPDAVKEIESM